MFVEIRQHIKQYLQESRKHFVIHRRDQRVTARQYLEGLLACEKGHTNMERMAEAVAGSPYRSYQQFISNSPVD